MRRRYLALSLICGVAALAACQNFGSDNGTHIAQYWRPISEPNVLMASDTLQKKLDFDLSQCHCGIYPANASHDDIVNFSPDQQRLAQTGVTVTPNDAGQCLQKPSLVVTECMRQRGWEPTNCSGRMTMPGGGALCATYVEPDLAN